MKFGIQFFPEIGPDEKTADIYWNESLDLVGLCDELGYSHIRTVEHFGHRYGGYSTNPIVFLSAASQRTRHARMITGAVLPVFNHPIKLAGEIGMLDAISRGRAEIGFARAFLPHEFDLYGRSMDESRARFDEGVEQVRLLLEGEDVTSQGQFHSFANCTSLPRPTQKPRPPFWIACSRTPDSFINAGRLGHSIMVVSNEAATQRDNIGLYRKAWKDAGHPGNGRVMLAIHMYCAPTDAQAVGDAKASVEAYFSALAEATSAWTQRSSKDYQGYDKMAAVYPEMTFEKLRAGNTCWVGAPADLVSRIRTYSDNAGGIDIVSLQVNFHTLPVDKAAASMRLFAREVMPHFAE